MTHPTGIHLGAFGWLENLRPAAAPVARDRRTAAAGHRPAGLRVRPPTVASSTRPSVEPTRPPPRCCAAGISPRPAPATTSRSTSPRAAYVRRWRCSTASPPATTSVPCWATSSSGTCTTRPIRPPRSTWTATSRGCGPGSRPSRESTSAPATPAGRAPGRGRAQPPRRGTGQRRSPGGSAARAVVCGQIRSRGTRTVWPMTRAARCCRPIPAPPRSLSPRSTGWPTPSTR
jgi:hypothetical protein